MAGDSYLFNNRVFQATNLDLFLYHLGLFPLALVFVLVRILGVKFLDIEVLRIGNRVGDAPGDVLVMSDDDAGSAWEADADDVDVSRDEVAFIPDRGCRLTEVGIVA